MNVDRVRSDRPAARIRFRAWSAALGAVVFGCAYFFVRQALKDGTWRFDATLVNKSLGTASLFLIALSMALTGVAVFWRPGSQALAYRKDLGLAGFWVGLAHGAVEHVLLPLLGLESESGPATRHAEALGLLALVLFALMALASNDPARGRMGTRAWRVFLRYAGYAGLALGLAHAAGLKAESWGRYVRTFRPVLPSLSLPVALFAAAVIVLRLAVWLRTRKRNGRRPTSTFPGP